MTAPRTEAAAPSQAALQAERWLLRDALQEHGDLIISCGLSLREAAYQGNDQLIRLHWRNARAVLLEAHDVLKQLEALGTAFGETERGHDLRESRRQLRKLVPRRAECFVREAHCQQPGS